MQTGASALLAAAAIATLYGLVHFFDLFRQQPSVAAEAQRIDFTPEGEADLATVDDVPAPEPAVKELVDALSLDPRLMDFGAAEAAPVKPVAVQPDEAAPAKTPRKASRRTTASQKKSKSGEPAPVVEPEPPAAHVPTIEEVTHVHVAPLFEPDPYVRMPRQGFGRRGRI